MLVSFMLSVSATRFKQTLKTGQADRPRCSDVVRSEIILWARPIGEVVESMAIGGGRPNGLRRTLLWYFEEAQQSRKKSALNSNQGNHVTT